MSLVRRWILFAILAVGCAGPAASPSLEPTIGASPTAVPGPTPAYRAPAGATPEAGPATLPPTQTPSAMPTPEGSPSPDAGGWIGPDLISSRHYLEPSLVIDADGFAHIAAELGSDIYYVTNRSGSWTRERLPRAPRGMRHAGPLIAIDTDGTLGVAYTPMCRACAGGVPDGVHFLTNGSGAWSTPVQISGGWAVALELVDGAIHLAYNDGDVEGLDDLNDLSRPLYATDAGGSWSVTELASIGAVLGMHLSPDGASHVLFSAWDHGESDRVTLNYATSTAAGEPFVVEPAPLPPAAYQAVSALDSEGAPHIIWATWHYDDENDWYSTTDPAYSAMRDGAWLEPEHYPASLPEALAIDGRGALHAVGGFWSEDQESIWYSTNLDGEFASLELGCCSSETEDGEWMSPGIALDSAGRPHVFFATDAGTWYAIGPAK